MSDPRALPVVEESGPTFPQRLGLLIFSAIFASGSWNLVAEPAPRAEQARRLGLPVPNGLVRWTGVVMLAGTAALQVAPLRRLAAALLALQLLLITAVGHRFWEEEPGPRRKAQQVHFSKNLSLLGAALFIAATPTPRRLILDPSEAEIRLPAR